MRIGLGFVLLLYFAGSALASDAATTFVDRKATYRSKNGDGKEYTLTIPYLEGGDATVAKRINTFVHDHVLATLPDASSLTAKPPRLIELAMPMEEVNSSGIEQHNKGRTIDVSVFVSGCGAYCSESTSTWTFDTRNGRLIAGHDLLTPGGSAALGREMVKLAAARLTKEIARIDKQLATHKATKERSVEEMETQLELYQSCLDDRYTKGGGLFPYYLKDPGVMAIGNGGLSFSYDECASHAVRALDDLGEFTRTLRGEELRPYLNAYGKYIVLGEGDGAVPAINPSSQYFSGTINGTITVTLFMGSTFVLNRDENFQGAHYYYDKYRKRIDLSIRRVGSRFELTEADSKDAVKPVLRFELKGEKLKGEWVGNGKSYPFEAHPL